MHREYFYLKCKECHKVGGDPPSKVKVAKNKGSYWSSSEVMLNDMLNFLRDHEDCVGDIVVAFDDDDDGLN